MSWRDLYLLDFAAVMLFLASYYRSCYRKGYRIDLWHAIVFLTCILPYSVMLPFAQNELNALIVGRDFAGVVAAVPHVFPLCMLGYFTLYVGGAFWKLRLGLRLRRETARLLDVAPRGSMMLMSSPDLLVLLTSLCLLGQVLMLSAYFATNGFGFNLREYTFEDPSIRPIAQIVALSSGTIIAHCVARYIEKRERAMMLCAALLTSGLVFFGQRGNLIFTYLNVVICYLIYRRAQVSLLRIASIGSSVLLLILYFGSLRAGVYALSVFLSSLAFLIFYGNNLSDLRDFAWMYSRWDHHLWIGKTYLAGLAAFVPRGISDFRATWSFGIASGRTVGLDTDLHPGLKPGEFGESYFNFGWPGIILAALIIGLVLRRCDAEVKAALNSPHPSMIKAFAATIPLLLAGCVSGSLSIPSLYSLFAMYFLGWLYLRVRNMLFPQRPPLEGIT